jgi:hypothetical protein
MKRIVLLLVVIALTAAAAACSPFRAVEALLVLDDARPGGGSGLYRALTADPERRQVAWSAAGRDRRGDLYTPVDGGDAGLVLVPGVARAGKDDPRLVAFATTLARAGFVVLVPDLAGLKELRVGSENVDEVADAVRHHAAAPAGGEPVRVGLVAISFAAGPAVIAALRDDTRERVGFVYTIGGYYDVTETLVFVTTGRYRETRGAPWRAGTANEYGKWVFLASNAARVADPRDRVSLQAIAWRKLRDRAADVTDLVAGLGAEGRSVYDLMTNRDPDRVATLLAGLPAAIREEMDALDPSRHDLKRFAGRLIALHGRDDPIIPHTQSVALAAAVDAGGAGRADAFIVSALTHVELTEGGLGDLPTLWRVACELLALRDSMTPPRSLGTKN